MVVKIKSICPVSLQDASEWGIRTVPHWLPSTAYYFEAAKTFEVNALVLIAWGVVRSSRFTGKEYNDNKDIFALGGRYKTYRDSVMCGASELSKFESTEMLQEQEAVEKIYAEVIAFASGLPPVVEPPKPPPVPTKLPPKEEPKKPAPVPENPPPSAPTTNWKKDLKWIGGFASAILVVWSIVSLALPGWAAMAGKVILQLLSSFFGS
jgi:hypothetical protein